jgi:hypothetical protein
MKNDDRVDPDGWTYVTLKSQGPQVFKLRVGPPSETQKSLLKIRGHVVERWTGSEWVWPAQISMTLHSRAVSAAGKLRIDVKAKQPKA